MICVITALEYGRWRQAEYDRPVSTECTNTLFTALSRTTLIQLYDQFLKEEQMQRPEYF